MTTLIRTPLNHLFPSLRAPIVSAPMAGAAGGKLAGEVFKAGGLGFIGGGMFTSEQMAENFSQAQEIVGKVESGRRIPIGVGMLAWRLTQLDKADKNELPSSCSKESLNKHPLAVALLDKALSFRPIAIWLAFGEPQELSYWSDVIRKREQELTKMGEELKLFIGVGTEEDARRAVEDCGADVIVAQGNEAGGHGNSNAPPLLDLVNQISKNLLTYKKHSSKASTLPKSSSPLLLAAGGLSSGSDLASLLSPSSSSTPSVHGAVFGTRFLLTPESTYSETQKAVLLSAKDGVNETIRSMAFDEARGPNHWPAGTDGRGIRSKTLKDFELGTLDLKERQERYKRALKEEDGERIIVWAGTGIGKVGKIQGAGEVVRDIMEDAVNVLRESGSDLIVGSR